MVLLVVLGWPALEMAELLFVTNVMELQSLTQAKRRGDLPVRFLQGRQRPKEYAEEVAAEADQYKGFNLIVMSLTDREKVFLPSGRCLQAKRLDHSFREKLKSHSDSELPVKDFVESLMTNNTRDDFSSLPRIYPPEREHQLSDIFVECDTPLGRFGTRSTSAATLKASGELSFYEKYLENDT